MSHQPRFIVARAVAVVVAFVLAGSVLGACKEDKKLKVTGIEPNTGDFQGGERITIKGNRFTKDGTRNAKVMFGGKMAEVIRFEGDDKLIVRAPGGTPGEKVDILIMFEPGGEITLKQAFTYIERDQADVKDLSTKKKPDAEKK